jgi:hypothetical protein
MLNVLMNSHVICIANSHFLRVISYVFLVQNYVERWLIFLSLESVAQNIGRSATFFSLFCQCQHLGGVVDRQSFDASPTPDPALYFDVVTNFEVFYNRIAARLFAF